MTYIDARIIHQALAGEKCDPDHHHWITMLAEEMIDNTIDQDELLRTHSSRKCNEPEDEEGLITSRHPQDVQSRASKTVSYTHLTLPTKA